MKAAGILSLSLSAVEILTELQGLHCLTSVQVDCIELLLSAQCFLYKTINSPMKYSIHEWIHNRDLNYDSFEFITIYSYAIFHYWIQYYEFRTLNSHLFSVMNSYYEFIIMKSNSWIQIEYNEFLYLNSYIYEFIYEIRIHTFE